MSDETFAGATGDTLHPGPAREYGRYRYAEGDTIGGRFAVHRRLRGGFGDVYLCYDRAQDYFYALKTLSLKQHVLDDPRTIPRLRREANIWIALGEHENVVQCFSFEILDSLPFLVLEWVTDDDTLSHLYETQHTQGAMFLDWYARLGQRGIPLRTRVTSRNRVSAGTTLLGWIDAQGALPLDMAVGLTLDICAAMIHAQQVHPGLVHRDLKPSNVLLDEQLRAKVTDFGTAVLASELLDQHETMGTWAYMAPELWRGEDVGVQADIYALGCTLYRMLTNRMPFDAPVGDRVAWQRQHETVPVPALPDPAHAQVNRIIQTCLAKAPHDRFTSFDELADVLSTLSNARHFSPAIVSSNHIPSSVDELNRRGIAHYGLENYDLALQFFARALDLDGSDANSYSNRGCVYHVLGRTEEALADYKQAIRLGNDDMSARVRNNRGLLYIQMGQTKRAISDFEKALSRDPGYASAYVNLGLVHMTQGRVDMALDCFQNALETNAAHVLAHHNLGYLYHTMGMLNEARQSYEAAVAHDPYFLQGFVNLYLLAGETGDEIWRQHYRDQVRRIDPELALSLDHAKANPGQGRPDPQPSFAGGLRDEILEPLIERQLDAWSQRHGARSANMATQLPLRPVVRIQDVRYAEQLHESVRRRQLLGERITQLAVRIDLLSGFNLDAPKPRVDECYLVLNERAMKMMEAEGLRRLEELKGHTVVLINSNPFDLEHPLDIRDVK